MRRLEAALDQGDRVGEIAAAAALSRIEQDRRGVKKTELLVEPCDRGFDHGGGAAVTAVRPVGPDRDRVELRCACHAGAPRSA